MKQTESIGKRIEKLLDEKDMTQRELANRVGVTEVTIGRYVKDTREPKGYALADIARALETTTDYLLGLSDDPNKEVTAQKPTSIAAHFDGEMTPEQEEKIREYAEFILKQRKDLNDK